MFKKRSKAAQTRVDDGKSARPGESKPIDLKPRPLDLTELSKVVGGTQAPKGGWSSQ